MDFLTRATDWLNHPFLHVGEWDLTAFVLIRLALYPAIAVLLAKWLRRAVRKTLRRQPHFDEASQKGIATVVYYVVLAVGILVALNAAGMPIQSLAVFSGAIGLGVGLGLQQFAQNFLSGILLLAGRSVRSGDWITVDGQEGSVEDIGVYSTLVRTPDDGELVIPNSQILNGKVVNWTRKRRLRRVSVIVPLSLAAAPEQLKGMLSEAAMSCEGVLKEPAPTASLKALRPTGADWEVSAWTSDFVDNPHALAAALMSASLDGCKRDGIDVA